MYKYVGIFSASHPRVSNSGGDGDCWQEEQEEYDKESGDEWGWDIKRWGARLLSKRCHS